jgi:hypothetical protein
VRDAHLLRQRAAKLFALAASLREERGPSLIADEVEQMGHQALAQAEAIEVANKGETDSLDSQRHLSSHPPSEER